MKWPKGEELYVLTTINKATYLSFKKTNNLHKLIEYQMDFIKRSLEKKFLELENKKKNGKKK